MPADICWAAYTKNLKLVSELLTAGADIESCDREGRTPLLNSVSGGNIQFELVSMLVNAGANINAQDKAGFSALHFCAQNKLPAIAYFLIENGGDVNIKDQWGEFASAKKSWQYTRESAANRSVHEKWRGSLLQK